MMEVYVTDSDGYEMEISEFGYVSDLDREMKLKDLIIGIGEKVNLPTGSFTIKFVDTGEEDDAESECCDDDDYIE